MRIKKIAYLCIGSVLLVCSITACGGKKDNETETTGGSNILPSFLSDESALDSENGNEYKYAALTMEEMKVEPNLVNYFNDKNLKITTVEIDENRETSNLKREDIAQVTIAAENDDVTFSGKYVITSKYKTGKGWEIEKIDQKEGSYLPKKGPAQEISKSGGVVTNNSFTKKDDLNYVLNYTVVYSGSVARLTEVHDATISFNTSTGVWGVSADPVLSSDCVVTAASGSYKANGSNDTFNLTFNGTTATLNEYGIYTEGKGTEKVNGGSAVLSYYSNYGNGYGGTAFKFNTQTPVYIEVNVNELYVCGTRYGKLKLNKA